MSAKPVHSSASRHVRTCASNGRAKIDRSSTSQAKIGCSSTSQAKIGCSSTSQAKSDRSSTSQAKIDRSSTAQAKSICSSNVLVETSRLGHIQAELGRPAFVKARTDRPSTPITEADRAGIDAFNAWMAKYGPVERAIIEAWEKRLEKKAERRAERPWIFGTLCELTDGAAKAWRSQGLSLDEQIKLAEGDSAIISFLIAYYGRSMTREIDRMKHQLKRPFYYEAENARRRGLAAARRMVKKHRTSNACPTREQVLDAWIHLKDSHEATIRFGSLIEDLACYVDHSLRFDEEGNICGRNGGVKAWLQENIPALALRYTTVMRYKAAARKLKQIAEIVDPTPADAIVGRVAQPGLEHGVRPAKPVPKGAKGATPATTGVTQVATGTDGEAQVAKGADGVAGERCACVSGGDMRNEIMLRTKNISGEAKGMSVDAKEISVELVRARAIWVEIVTGIKANPTALVARLNELVDPERIADATMLAAWRERYGREITQRTKTSWLRRLLRQVVA